MAPWIALGVYVLGYGALACVMWRSSLRFYWWSYLLALTWPVVLPGLAVEALARWLRGASR